MSDYFSDFFELDHLRSTMSVSVIRKLKALFARHGIPQQLVTDHGPQFSSSDFLKFASEWDFDHRTSSPCHSQSNGKAESAVREAKKILLKCMRAGSDAFLALLDHRNTQPSVIQISPAQCFLNRRTRSLLPMSAGLLKPSVVDEDTTHTKFCPRQQQQARYYNRGARDLEPLEKGDVVRFQPWQDGKKEWQKGIVKNHLSERSYKVELPEGVLCRNRIHLRKTNEPPVTTNVTQSEQCNKPQEPAEPVTETNGLPSQSAIEVPNEVPVTLEKAPAPRCQRVRRAPKYLEEYVST